MSRKSQSARFERFGDRKSEIITLTQDYVAGQMVALHFHDRDQLVYASQGVMTVRTADAVWVVPPHRAVWIPALVPHSIAMSGRVAMRTLYLRRKLVRNVLQGCCVINVLPLLKELILHACKFRTLKKSIRRQKHIVDLVIDQLETVQTVPLRLPHPSDPRSMRVADALMADPSNRGTLDQICKGRGASKRTVERLFQQETGMTFGKWRQQLRLMESMRLLAEGEKVTHAAVEAGYSSPSAFISMFRKVLGTTPTRYFNNGRTSLRNAMKLRTRQLSTRKPSTT
jgi:AraC-like DNA-binding protein